MWELILCTVIKAGNDLPRRENRSASGLQVVLTILQPLNSRTVVLMMSDVEERALPLLPGASIQPCSLFIKLCRACDMQVNMTFSNEKVIAGVQDL